MRLSEAIRLGATMRPQSVGHFLDDDGASCAQGAALDAVGRLSESATECRYAMSELWPWSYYSQHIVGTLKGVTCPDGGGHMCRYYADDSINGIIAHLNNEHRWTRERIADWVELHEPLPAIEATESQEVAL